MAAEGTYSAEQVNQLLTCPVCLDRYNSPKILPCQHTVCKSPCMEGLIDRFSRMIRCPECRAEHFVPRTGVDGFPTNITISGFLDLQAQAARPQPPEGQGTSTQGGTQSGTQGGTQSSTQPSSEGGTGQRPVEGGTRPVGKCAVCEREGERRTCIHCDKLLCGECHQSHTDQMKMEVLRLVTQIRRGLPKLAKCLSTAEHRTEVLKQHVDSVRGEVAATTERYVRALKEREATLHNELEMFLLGELRSLRGRQETLEVEMASVSSYCDSMETFLNNAGQSGNNVPQADLVNMKHQCGEYMQQVRNAENEPMPPMRRASYHCQTQPIQAAISDLGSITSSDPGGGGGASAANHPQAQPTTNTQRTNQRARWGDRSPRMPLGAQGGGANASRSRENQPDFFNSRPSRSDESWLHPSPQGGSTSQSIYLPSRTEDYMYQMSTNTDDIFQVIDEIRRQEEWEMNASIRENARNRNTRQNANVFDSPRSQGNTARGRNANREERTGGLMGGGATPRESAGQVTSTEPARSSRSTGANGAPSTGRPGQPMDSESLRDLEEEIHNMDTSNQATTPTRGRRGSQTASRNTRGATSRGQHRGASSSTNQNHPVAQAGAAAVARANQNQEDTATTTQTSSPANNNNNRSNRQNNRNTGSTNRGGGNPGRRNTYRSRANNPRGGGTNSNTGSRNTEPSTTESPAAASNRPRRISQQQQVPGGDMSRGRTFVQDEPATAEAATDLPSVSNNGMSFSIAFEDDNTTPDLNAGNSTYRVTYSEKATAVLTLGSGRGNDREHFTWPRGVAISPTEDKIVIADSSNHRVKVYDFAGHLLSVFGSYGQNEGEFDCLAGVAVNTMGQIIISDRYNHRIQVFDPAGTFMHAFGTEGNGDGQLNYPWGVATDNSGFIYVCDKENHRIQVFQQNGTFVRKFGGLGNQPGKLENPHYLVVTQDNRVIVSDSSNHRLQVFTNTGRFIKTISAMGTALGQLKYPKGLAVDPNGYIIVADSGNSRIQILQPNGRYHYHFGSSGTQTGQFRGIEALALSKTGTIVVSDKDNHRIQTF